MNPLRNERDAFRLLLLVIGGAAGVAAAGTLGDGWTALAVVLSLLAGVGVGMWVASRREGAAGEPAPAVPVRQLPILVVAPAELAGPALAREVAAEEAATAVRALVLVSETQDAEEGGRAAAELRALLEEHGLSAQAISVAHADAQRAVAAELRDGVVSHVFVATHRSEHPAFADEEQLVHAIDRASETPVVAVAFAAS